MRLRQPLTCNYSASKRRYAGRGEENECPIETMTTWRVRRKPFRPVSTRKNPSIMIRTPRACVSRDSAAPARAGPPCSESSRASAAKPRPTSAALKPSPRHRHKAGQLPLRKIGPPIPQRHRGSARPTQPARPAATTPPQKPGATPARPAAAPPAGPGTPTAGRSATPPPAKIAGSSGAKPRRPSAGRPAAARPSTPVPARPTAPKARAPLGSPCRRPATGPGCSSSTTGG